MRDRVIAKFKGTDGSLGYRKGRIYVLEVIPGLEWIHPHSGRHGSSPLAIRRVKPWYMFWGSDGTCPYDSREAFNRNWDILEI